MTKPCYDEPEVWQCIDQLNVYVFNIPQGDRDDFFPKACDTFLPQLSIYLRDGLSVWEVGLAYGFQGVGLATLVVLIGFPVRYCKRSLLIWEWKFLFTSRRPNVNSSSLYSTLEEYIERVSV